MTGLFSLVAFIVGMVGLGNLACRLLFSRHQGLSFVERAAFSGALATSIWIAIAWTLALPGALTRRNLLIAAGCAILLTAGPMLRALRLFRVPHRIANGSALAVLVLLPVAAYTAFLFWKGAVIPPAAPDGLTYHMPRAAMIARSGTVKPFASPDLRINRLPADYELLLATVILLDRGDAHTEWLSTLFFLLFLVAAAAVAVQWFGGGAHAIAVVLVMCSMPVLLLQGALHKNDLMVSTLLVIGLLALGRWIDNPGAASAVMLGLCMLTAIGTKSQGLIVAAFAFVPFVVTAIRHVRSGIVPLRRLIAAAALLVALVPLLGGWAYVIAERSAGTADGMVQRVAPVEYGEWSHLWVIPLLTLSAPFLTNDTSIVVPWNGERWLWGGWDPFASHFGATMSVIAILFPVALWRSRHASAGSPFRTRLTVTAVALASATAMLGVHSPIYGYVSGFPRYLLYTAPVIAVWVVSPLVQAARRTPRLVPLFLVLLALLAAQTAFSAADREKFAPLADVLRAAENPGQRWMPAMGWRATSVADRLAGPADVIDVHGGLDTWTYPLFGPALHRDLKFIRDASEIRDSAQWVVVERAYNAVWGDPAFRHMRDYPRYLGRGKPTEEDLHVIRQLLHDPRWKPVFLEPHMAQAVFQRVHEPARRTSYP